MRFAVLLLGGLLCAHASRGDAGQFRIEHWLCVVGGIVAFGIADSMRNR